MSEIGRSIDEIDTPFLWVDLNRMESNIERMAAHFREAGVGWRPHTKGIKVPAIAHRLLKAGAIGITCAKLGEAEVMAAAGIDRILVANQIVGSQKLRRLASLSRQIRILSAVDSTFTLDELSALAQEMSTEVELLIEVDAGMGRAGCDPGQPTVALAQEIEAREGLRFAGLMAWEGHALSADGEEEKRRMVQESVSLLIDSVDLCRSAGLDVEIVSCGGSGTFRITSALPGVTEIQAGGGIFRDQTYARWGVEGEAALFVRSSVTSRPAPDRIIFDAGFKTLPTWITPPLPLGIGEVEKVVASAEHGIVTLKAANKSLGIGDGVDFVVGYGDATVFLHDQIYAIRDERVEAIWRVAGRGKIR